MRPDSTSLLQTTIPAELSFFIEKYFLCVQISFLSGWTICALSLLILESGHVIMAGTTCTETDGLIQVSFEPHTHGHTLAYCVKTGIFCVCDIQPTVVSIIPRRLLHLLTKRQNGMGLLLSCKRRGNCICTGHEL
jgi:hypothetical protein